MALNPNIPLSARASDLSQLGQSISRGIDNTSRMQQLRQEAQLHEQQLIQNKFNALDDRQQRVTRSLIQGAASIESLVDNNDDKAIELSLNNRIDRLNELGIDTSDTQRELQTFRDNPDIFKSNIKNAVNFGERLGLLKKKPERSKGFTLGKGQQRFDAQGNIIAQGAKEEDKAPDGFRFTETGNLEPIPGGKADFERKAGQEKINASIELAEAKSKLVVTKVDEALALIDKELGVTGLTGKVTGLVAGTDAFSLRKNLATIQANLGFDSLQKMRDASPTGGALGQVSERELDLLISAVAALDIGLTKDVLVKNLNEVRVHYNKWLETVKKANQETSATLNPNQLSVNFLGFE